MTVAYGTNIAKGFGDRHEEDPGQPKKEKEMDLYNNEKGRSWSNKKEGPLGACLQGVKDKKLKKIN